MNDHEQQCAPHEGLTPEQLAAFEHGWAATIMPVHDGWKIDYFSVPDFEALPGTTFPTFAEAITAVSEVLPAVNSPEERERARSDLSSVDE